MTPLLVNLELWLSLFFSGYQLIISRNDKYIKFLAIASIGLLISSLASFFLLIYLHIVSDFTLLKPSIAHGKIPRSGIKIKINVVAIKDFNEDEFELKNPEILNMTIKCEKTRAILL